jgi:TRAP-type mannitol/chloroaromatic compound transport system substrate-binding protein
LKNDRRIVMRVKKLSLLVLIVVAALVSLPAIAGCAAPTPSGSKVYELRIQSLWPRGDISIPGLDEFVASAAKKSNGQLKITVFAEPEIVPMDQLFDSTKNGTIDMLQGGGAFWAGTLPFADVEWGLLYSHLFPEGMTIEQEAASVRKFFFDSGMVDLLRQEYAKQNLYWLDMHTYGPCCTLSTKPIRTMSDVQGVKVADPGGWQSIWHNALGYTSVPNFPGGEVYMALKLGTIDAINWDISGITGLSWYEVAPYWIRCHESDHAVGCILVNMDVWKSLPDNTQKALAGAAEDYFTANSKAYAAEYAKAQQLIKEGKVIEVKLDPDAFEKHKEAGRATWAEAAKDPIAAKAVEIMKKFSP